MNHFFYPVNWPALAREIKESCRWRCQECGQQCRRPGELYLGAQYELTVAHYNGDYDSESIFVAALCLPCHFRHDARYGWSARRRHERKRRQMAGQLELNCPIF